MRTAEDFINTNINVSEYPLTMDKAVLLMIEFAKLHVEAALKVASEKAKIDKSVTFGWEKVDRPSILKSYPLENIK